MAFSSPSAHFLGHDSRPRLLYSVFFLFFFSLTSGGSWGLRKLPQQGYVALTSLEKRHNSFRLARSALQAGWLTCVVSF